MLELTVYIVSLMIFIYCRDDENTSWQNKDNRFSSGQRNNNNEAIEYNSRSNHQNVTAEKFDSCRK